MKKSLTFQCAIWLLALSAALPAQEPAADASKPGQPAGKHVPQARTQPEFNDYTAANAVTGGAAAEKAADDFSAKYPDSELKLLLYSKALREYQTENKQAQIPIVGAKYLRLDPDNPVVLVLTANALLDGLADTDKDHDSKIAEIKRLSSHALQTIDTNFAPPAGATPEQVTAYKKSMQTSSHSTLGIVALRAGDDATAETELKMAVELNVGQPDPVLWFDLALAQDHQQKYAEALASINKAAEYAGSDPDLATRVRGELARLRTLNHVAPETAKPVTPSPK
jgi:tetratricopeptide (TPR) repeat protein